MHKVVKPQITKKVREVVTQTWQTEANLSFFLGLLVLVFVVQCTYMQMDWIRQEQVRKAEQAAYDLWWNYCSKPITDYEFWEVYCTKAPKIPGQLLDPSWQRDISR